MKICIFFLSRIKEDLCFFERKRESLIPEEIRNQYRIRQNVTFNTIFFKENISITNIQNILLKSIGDSESVVCIVDKTIDIEFFDSLTKTFPFYSFNNNGDLKQSFSMVLSRIIPTIFWSKRKFDDFNTLRIMCLPHLNFDSEELRCLCDIYKNLFKTNKLDVDKLERCISKLLKRKRPKKKSSFPNQYIFDDRGYGFEFAMEKHSLVERSIPPHTSLCVLNGIFRFGQRIDRNRHYNVTKGEKDKEKVSGKFINCHEIEEEIKEESHINMFPNGFFKKGVSK